MTPSPPPLRYDAALEVLEPAEAESIDELVATLRHISEITYRDCGCPLRSVHAKGHALLRGELHIPADLPATLAQGLFAQPGVHAVTLRVSTTPGDLLDDNVSTPRGLAMKVHGVAGARLDDDDEADTQDFIFVDSPTFHAPSLKKFLGSLKLLAATTDKAPGFKKALSAALRGAERLVERTGHRSATLVALGGHPETHPLGETYFTQVPLRYGHHVAKMSLLPDSEGLRALSGAPVDLKGRPNGLRAALATYFADHEAQWLLRAQLCTDRETMPIEDASVLWPEEDSPFVPVARLACPRQVAWSNTAEQEERTLSFSPWHGIQAHRPLGAVMRARRQAYAMSAAFRRERAGSG
jgi:hypothetical protein